MPPPATCRRRTGDAVRAASEFGVRAKQRPGHIEDDDTERHPEVQLVWPGGLIHNEVAGARQALAAVLLDPGAPAAAEGDLHQIPVV
ncbi:hypothetical protein OG254_48515 [Streptomyces sp. NBC_01092]|nr:hypothetical protein OG254_48515 [Streptomyces sp. NBC_01092]